jgi:hypothetical protein
MIYYRRNVMVNAAPSAIYSPIAKLAVFSSRFLCCGKDLAGRSGARLPTPEKTVAKGTFEIRNYCGAVK